MLPVRVFGRPVVDFFPESFGTLSRRLGDVDGFFNWRPGTPGEIGSRVDIHEDQGDLVIEAEVPGLTKDDLEITVEGGVLTISGEYKSTTDEEKANYHLRERRYGRFSGSFRLLETANGDKVTADLANGVLTLRIPTREEAKPRKIKVK